MMISRILFVCIGNICRSPMAEWLFREKLKDRPDMLIESAGLHALVGKPAVLEARNTMESVGIDISSHRARQLSSDMALSFDLILVMDKEQQRDAAARFPFAMGKIHTLGKWSDFEVLDPYMGSKELFTDCLELFEQGWKDWGHKIR